MGSAGSVAVTLRIAPADGDAEQRGRKAARRDAGPPIDRDEQSNRLYIAQPSATHGSAS